MKDKVYVKLARSFANPQRVWEAGKVYEWDAEDAQRLVAAGAAEIVKKPEPQR